jgi:hypothetical protein
MWPERWKSKQMTVGWLLTESEQGRLPRVELSPVAEATAMLHLNLEQIRDPDVERRQCRTVDGRSITLNPYETIRVEQPTNIWLVMDDGRLSEPKQLDPLEGESAVARTGPLEVIAAPGPWTRSPGRADTSVPVTLCSVPDPHILKVLPQNAAVFEGDDDATTIPIRVSLSAPSEEPVTVDWKLAAADTTDAASNVAPSRGTVTFAPGDTMREVSVTAVGDTVEETDERLIMTFSNATNAAIGGYYGIALVAIVDDD